LSPEKEYIAGYLRTVSYPHALELQQRLMKTKAEGIIIPDFLLLLQHPPLFTIGRFRGEDDIIVPRETLEREGIAVFDSNRGGGVTYHGPGQLVGYPIINLKENGLDIREYIHRLEQVIIELMLKLGIDARRREGYPGVWAGQKKVCSIGIHVSHHITMHGFALNVSTNLRHFELINPCGIKGKVMTSVSQLLGRPVEVEGVIEPLLDCFSSVFRLKRGKGDETWQATLDALRG